MVDGMSDGDIRRVYNRSLLLYKDKLTFVSDTEDGYVVIQTVPSNNKPETVKFSRKDFKPLRNRIGMINVDGHALYLARVTSRQYTLGANAENTSIRKLSGAPYSLTIAKLSDHGRKMWTQPFYDAYYNIYPTLEEAAKKVLEGTHSIVAFDKQFAITKRSTIYYKTTPVGVYKEGRIVFHPEYEHLTLLLENGYEKSEGNSKLKTIEWTNRN